MAKDNILDEIIKIGLVLGSLWLGSEIIKNLSEDKRGNNVAGT